MDVVKRGPRDAQSVAALVGMQGYEVEAIERRRLPMLREAMKDYEGQGQDREEVGTPLGNLASAMQGGVEQGLRDEDEDRSGRVLPDRFYISAYPRGHKMEGKAADVDDEEYLRAFWKVYERKSRWRHVEAGLAAAEARGSTKKLRRQLAASEKLRAEGQKVSKKLGRQARARAAKAGA
jgi:hypothetical protein